ncbi:MAG: hypothetical protein ACYCOU_12115 [Sulfobacillus sp.]
MDIKILEPSVNRGYMPQPIPVSRDNEIAELLSRVVAENRVARFARELSEGHAAVLRAFAERMATASIRKRDPALLQLAMIGLLLSWRGPDYRETLAVFPVLYHAILRMELDIEAFIASIRQNAGDQMTSPFIEFLARSEHDKTLEVMGYAVGADRDGFRYVRNW